MLNQQITFNVTFIHCHRYYREGSGLEARPGTPESMTAEVTATDRFTGLREVVKTYGRNFGVSLSDYPALRRKPKRKAPPTEVIPKLESDAMWVVTIEPKPRTGPRGY